MITGNAVIKSLYVSLLGRDSDKVAASLKRFLFGGMLIHTMTHWVK